MNKADCILRWHGSKRQLAPAIVKLFPRDYEKLIYVEPFCGGAAVYFVKRPSRSEVLNDLDGDLVNVLLTIKFHAHELIRCLRLVPNSRALFAEALDAGVNHGIWAVVWLGGMAGAARVPRASEREVRLERARERSHETPLARLS